MNPALSSWMAIRQQLSAGVKNRTVLVLGATGYAGRLAVEIARYLGARKVIAAGRNQEILQSLPADALRSNNLRLLGSGIGSIPVAVFGKELFLLAQLVADGKFNVHPLKCQLTDFNQDNWQNTKQRIVYIPNQFKPVHQGILSKLQENIKFTIMKAVVNLKLSH